MIQIHSLLVGSYRARSLQNECFCMRLTEPKQPTQVAFGFLLSAKGLQMVSHRDLFLSKLAYAVVCVLFMTGSQTPIALVSA